MGFLSSFFIRVVIFVTCCIVCPKVLCNKGLRCLKELLRKIGGIRTHVGNKPLLVELLGDLHRLARSQSEFAVGFLLESGRDERRSRAIGERFFRHALDLPGFLVQTVFELAGFGLGQDEDVPSLFFVGRQFAGGFAQLRKGIATALAKRLLPHAEQNFNHRLRRSVRHAQHSSLAPPAASG